MTSAIFGLLLRACVAVTGTALATFAVLWHAPGDPALAVVLARDRWQSLPPTGQKAGLSGAAVAAFEGKAAPEGSKNSP